MKQEIKAVNGRLIFPDNSPHLVTIVTMTFSNPVDYRELSQIIYDNMDSLVKSEGEIEWFIKGDSPNK